MESMQGEGFLVVGMSRHAHHRAIEELGVVLRKLLSSRLKVSTSGEFLLHIVMISMHAYITILTVTSSQIVHTCILEVQCCLVELPHCTMFVSTPRHGSAV